jgi:hypothetical protein
MKRRVGRSAKLIALVEWGGDAWLLPAGSRAASGAPGRGADLGASEGSFEAGEWASPGVRGQARAVEVAGSEREIVTSRSCRKNALRSGDAAGDRRGERLVDDLIDEKIIGHRMWVGSGAAGWGLAIFLLVAVAMFHEPTGQHGAGVFVEPLVQQGADLLTEIGGVAEASEFIGL